MQVALVGEGYLNKPGYILYMYGRLEHLRVFVLCPWILRGESANGARWPVWRYSRTENAAMQTCWPRHCLIPFDLSLAAP